MWVITRRNCQGGSGICGSRMTGGVEGAHNAAHLLVLSFLRVGPGLDDRPDP